MILSSLIGIKLAGGIASTKKMIGVSLLTSTCSDLFWGTVSYKYWDGKKQKTLKVKKRKKPCL